MNKKSTRYTLFALVMAAALLVSACQTAVPGTGETPAVTPGEPAAPGQTPAVTPGEPAAPGQTPGITPGETTVPAATPTEPMPPDEDAPLYGGTLVVPRWPDLRTCNPGTSLGTDITVSGILGNIFDPLIRPNADLEFQPQLATSWEVSDDGLTITWNLRDDVTWHDGVPFTSADVKFTYEGPIRDQHARGRIVYDALDRVETPDDYTAIFHMTEPRAAAIFQAHGSEGLIIPKHIYENEDLIEGPHATCAELPIGTGPFRAVEYIVGERFVIERNEDWWGASGDYWGEGQPYLDRVIFTFLVDVSSRVNCLESGECGYVGMQMLPENEVARFNAMPGREVQIACTTQALGIMNLFGINLRREPLNDVSVRQAISYALNRDIINERVYYGTGSPTTTFVGPESPWYVGVTNYDQDLDRANQLLDEAGYPRGAGGTRFSITITHDTRPTHTDLANIFQQFMAEIGIAVNIETLDFTAWVDKVHIEQDFDVMVSILGVGDPGVGAARLFRSDNIDPAPFNNSAGYINEEIDELWDQFATTFDFEQRRTIMEQIQQIITTDLPYIYVMSSAYPLGYNSDEYAGIPTDCGRGDDLLRAIWWKGGRPAP